MGGAAGHMAHPFDCREVRNGQDLINFYVKAVNNIPLYQGEASRDEWLADFGGVNPTITPTGSNLTWYDDISLTNQVGTGATFTLPSSIVGNATSITTVSYWVVDQPGTCFSSPLQVDFQINPLPQPGPIWHN